MFKRFYQNPNIVAAIVAVGAFMVYLLTLAPTVTFIDSGELAAVATTLGIAHPTGYPLFTLLGWVFAHVPVGLRTITQLNLMSAVFCAAAVFFFFHLFLYLSSLLRATEKGQPGGGSLTVDIIAAAAATLALGFSETFWSQAVELEVYSLHILFLSLMLLLFLRALGSGKSRDASDARQNNRLAQWYAFALVLGLSFTNHMTTILLAPAFLYLFFATLGFSGNAWNRILRAGGPFAVGLSVYLYLPLRAAQDPLFNWGNPVTLERFWWHFTGKQYRVWIFSSTETAKKQFEYFLETFPPEFAYVGLVVALIGAVRLFKLHRKLFFFTTILFLSCVFYAINYDIHDIDSYFLLAYVTTGIWIAIGLEAILSYADRMRRRSLGTAACVVVALAPVFTHYTSVDQSKNYAVEDYTMNMFDSFEENAIVMSYQWDYWLSASYYYQFVEGKRTDVVVLDKELFRRSWYFKQLERQHPWLIENSRREIDEFLQELYKFEHNLPYNPMIIQARFEALINSFLMNNHHERPVYATPEIEPEFLRGFQKVPSGLAFRLTADTTFQPIAPTEFAFRPIRGKDKYSEMILTMYANAYINQGSYLAMRGDRVAALRMFGKALEIRPGSREALAWMQRLGAK